MTEPNRITNVQRVGGHWRGLSWAELAALLALAARADPATAVVTATPLDVSEDVGRPRSHLRLGRAMAGLRRRQLIVKADADGVERADTYTLICPPSRPARQRGHRGTA